MKFLVDRCICCLLLPEAGLVYCGAIAGIIEASAPVPPWLPLLVRWMTASQLGVWVIADGRRRQVSLPYDMGTFVFFGSFVVLPAYLWSTRRWRGMLTLAWILMLLCVPFLGAWLALGASGLLGHG